MDKNRRLSQNVKTIWALTTLFICQDNDLNNILNENQMKILLKSLKNTRVDLFEAIFFDFFTDQQHVICDMFEKYLNFNLQNPSQEALIILFFYYNLIEKRSQFTIPKYDFDNCIQDVIKFGSITEDLKCLDSSEKNSYEIEKT
ncbi:hypothetical protein BpHYR1_002560 [Brachionus plicatilis]|uniref:Uncharacterized protein n=1 Tax=Brachionus plicatilis TaxID=10195 RepID=A0A3M7RH75_BRAPC|nr:hypothetical protein BpHYR1_002560 [Brachionus plicatilis]